MHKLVDLLNLFGQNANKNVQSVPFFSHDDHFRVCVKQNNRNTSNRFQQNCNFVFFILCYIHPLTKLDYEAIANRIAPEKLESGAIGWFYCHVRNCCCRRAWKKTAPFSGLHPLFWSGILRLFLMVSPFAIIVLPSSMNFHTWYTVIIVFWIFFIISFSFYSQISVFFWVCFVCVFTMFKCLKHIYEEFCYRFFAFIRFHLLVLVYFYAICFTFTRLLFCTCCNSMLFSSLFHKVCVFFCFLIIFCPMDRSCPYLCAIPLIWNVTVVRVCVL